MVVNLSSLQPEVVFRPPKMILYGRPGVGKSTFANRPGTIFFDIEDGLDGQSVVRYPVRPEDPTKLKYIFKEYQEVLDACNQLYLQEHSFNTLVIDTVDWVEKLIWKHFSQVHNKNIADVPYGNGYKLVLPLWDQLLSCLDVLRNQKNMMILLLAHDKIERFDDPSNAGYNRYALDVHKEVNGRLIEWADMVLFANFSVQTTQEDVGFGQKKTKGIGVSNRIIHTVEHPSYLAKNRYNLPAEIPMDSAEFWRVFGECATHIKSQHNIEEETVNE